MVNPRVKPMLKVKLVVQLVATRAIELTGVNSLPLLPILLILGQQLTSGG